MFDLASFLTLKTYTCRLTKSSLMSLCGPIKAGSCVLYACGVLPGTTHATLSLLQSAASESQLGSAPRCGISAASICGILRQFFEGGVLVGQADALFEGTSLVES